LEVFVQLPDDQVLTIYGLHEDGFTLPAPDPSIRLDYIFVDPVRQVVTQPRVVRAASDHPPLLVEFKV
jgi:endonuclease/exonuclease/phosphatase (EEP) superfamily protein YafD